MTVLASTGWSCEEHVAQEKDFEILLDLKGGTKCYGLVLSSASVGLKGTSFKCFQSHQAGWGVPANPANLGGCSSSAALFPSGGFQGSMVGSHPLFTRLAP